MLRFTCDTNGNRRLRPNGVTSTQPDRIASRRDFRYAAARGIRANHLLIESCASLIVMWHASEIVRYWGDLYETVAECFTALTPATAAKEAE